MRRFGQTTLRELPLSFAFTISAHNSDGTMARAFCLSFFGIIVESHHLSLTLLTDLMARKKITPGIPLPAPPDDGQPIEAYTQHQARAPRARHASAKQQALGIFFLPFPPSLLMSYLVDQDAQGKEARKTAKYATQALRGRQVLEELNDFARLDPESEEDNETSSNELGDEQPVSVSSLLVLDHTAKVIDLIVPISLCASQWQITLSQRNSANCGTNTHATCRTGKPPRSSEAHSPCSSYPIPNAACSKVANGHQYSLSSATSSMSPVTSH